MLSLLKDMRAISLLLAATLTILSNMLISPALPGIEAAFSDEPHAGILTRLLITAPSLTAAIVALFAGSLADRIGRKRQLIIGVVLFAVVGTAGLWLTSLPAILASRLVLGVSVALIMTAQTALIGDLFDGASRANFLGLQIAVSNIAGLFFVLAAGWFAGFSPFLPFAIYGVALLYLPLMLKFINEEKRQTDTRTEATGTAASGWARTLAAIAVITVASLVGFYLVPTQFPFFLAQIGYSDPSTSAIVLAMVTLCGGLVSLLQAGIVARVGSAYGLAIGFVFFLIGFSGLATSQTFWHVFVAAIFIGAATGILFPLFIKLALDVSPAESRGMASGAITTAFFLGQFLSPLLSQPLIDNFGFPLTFAAAAAMYVGLGLVGFLLLRTSASTQDRR